MICQWSNFYQDWRTIAEEAERQAAWEKFIRSVIRPLWRWFRPTFQIYRSAFRPIRQPCWSRNRWRSLT